MRKGPLTVLIVIIILIVVALAVWFWYPSNSGDQVLTPTSTTPVASAPLFDQSLSDATITVMYPSTDFELATSSNGIMTNSNIPPCDANFDYCLYYIGSDYSGTNFTSAGIRIENRAALTTQSQCLTTPPTGYPSFTATVTTSSDYAVSEFPPLNNGAAGSYSNDTLYRLFYSGSCYELETRIGQSQFANYPSGTIQEFTSNDENALQGEMQQILDTLTLPTNEVVAFPAPSSTATSGT